MNKSILPIFGLLFTVLSSQAFALDFEWDKCAFINDPRSYKECRGFYGYGKPSQEDFKSYICKEAGSSNAFNLDIKVQNGVLKVRKSNSPWSVSSSNVYVTKNGAVIGHDTSSGEFITEATCAVQ